MKANDIVFDATTKDHVCVSNGIPIKDANGAETSNLEVTEAIAFRHIIGSGFFWTYVSVKGHTLRPSSITQDEWRAEMAKSKGRI